MIVTHYMTYFPFYAMVPIVLFLDFQNFAKDNDTLINFINGLSSELHTISINLGDITSGLYDLCLLFCLFGSDY